MKRNLIAVIVLTGIAMLFFVAVAVLGFYYGEIVAGTVGVILAVITLWLLAGSVWREICYERYMHRFHARDFYGAKQVLDKGVRHVLFYPILRLTAYQLYMQVYTALGDMASAERYISLLRGMGGAGWRYRTSFYFVLLNLGWQDIAAAREEYEEFVKNCGHAAIYQEQIEVLTALFRRIDGENPELPEAVKNSPYPAVHKAVERY